MSTLTVFWCWQTTYHFFTLLLPYTEHQQQKQLLLFKWFSVNGLIANMTEGLVKNFYIKTCKCSRLFVDWRWCSAVTIYTINVNVIYNKSCSWKYYIYICLRQDCWNYILFWDVVVAKRMHNVGKIEIYLVYVYTIQYGCYRTKRAIIILIQTHFCCCFRPEESMHKLRWMVKEFCNLLTSDWMRTF